MTEKYEVVVGLEVHAEMCTETKAFCSCKNEFGAPVNTHVCPNCLGLPGTLPTLNEAYVDFGIKVGHALGCSFNKISKFDRKNYFYPDLVKGYQTTQFDVPLCKNGCLELLYEDGTSKKIRVNRAHLEEDTAKLIHDESFDGTLIDFNRCGVPLLEIVSEPDLRSAADAKLYLDTLRSVLVTLGVSDGKMQEGSIRSDVNVSVRKKGETAFGTRVEMKNVNTFSGAQRAIEYEAQRQIDTLERGGKIDQETRRWDDVAGVNTVMRSKENANDYRYFPEPDLLTLIVDDERIERLKKEIPEMPHDKTRRFMTDYGLSHYDADLLVQSPDKAAFLEACAAKKQCQPKNLANWILGDISRILNEKNLALPAAKLTPENLCELVKLLEDNKISSASGKVVIEIILFEDKSPAAIVQEKNLAQISDNSALEQIAKAVLAANPGPVAQYKSGKTNVIGFLVGQCMKESKGQGNPAVLKEILERLVVE